MVRVRINEEESLYLQRLYYEYNGLLNLANQFTSNTALKPDDARYRGVIHDYLVAYAEFNMALREMGAKCAAQEGLTLFDHNINVDFAFDEIVFTNKEENGNGCRSCSNEH